MGNNINIDYTYLVGNQYIKYQIKIEQSGIKLLFGKYDILLSGGFTLQYLKEFINKGGNIKGIRPETVLTLDRKCLVSVFAFL